MTSTKTTCVPPAMAQVRVCGMVVPAQLVKEKE